MAFPAPGFYDRTSYLAVGILLGVIAVFLLRRARPRRSSWFLAAYLGAVAANFICDFMANAMGPGTPGWFAWRRAGLAFLAIDPALLLLTVRGSTDSRAWQQITRAAVVGTGLFLVGDLLGPAWFWREPPTRLWLVFVAYLGCVYLAALAKLTRDFAAATDPGRVRVIRAIFLAMAAALLPRITYVPIEAGLFPLGFELAGREFRVDVAVQLLLLLFGFVGLRAWAIRNAEPERVQPVRREVNRLVPFLGVIAIVEAAFLATAASPNLNVFGAALQALSGFAGPGTSVGRWIIASFFLLRGLISDGTLGSAPKDPRRLALLGSIVMGPAIACFLPSFILGASSLVGRSLTPLGREDAAIVLIPASVVATASGYFCWRWCQPPAGTGDAAVEEAPERARLDSYRRALQEARDKNRPLDSSQLRDLRQALGITPLEHHLTQLVLQSETSIRTPTAVVEVGSLVSGRYRIEALVGQGSAGRTYRARDEAAGQTVAVKHLPIDRGGTEESQMTGFILDAERAGRRAHPRTVRIIELGKAGADYFVVMEFVGGGSLAERLRKGPFKPGDASRILVDVMEGLSWIHAQGIVHRDLKPSNILLTEDGRAKIGDFGIAIRPHELDATASSLTAAFQPGTVAYMAPEQARGSPAIDKAADLYSVAVIAYEMFLGKRYLDFRGLTDFETREKIQESRPLLPHRSVSRELNAWLARGLGKEPRKRFPSAAAMRTAFLACPEAGSVKSTGRATGTDQSR